MSHIVINRFREKNHKDHIYEVDDVYPAEGFKTTKARLKELSTTSNKYEKVYIQETKAGE